PPVRDMPAKPALVVGLAQARKQKRVTGGPTRMKPVSQPPPIPKRTSSTAAPRATRGAPPPSRPPPAPRKTGNAPRPTGPPVPAARRPLPSPFTDKTRSVVDDEVASSVRPTHGFGKSLFDEPTRLGDVDAALIEQTRPHKPIEEPQLSG